jgi:hypothetical protein
MQEQARGTHASNPRKGELARKVEESRTAYKAPESRQEERLVVRSLSLFQVHIALMSETAHTHTQWD